MKILCLSNGHGEDGIAVQILKELQKVPHPPELAALPLVGEGHAYRVLGNVPLIGPVKKMPSGGFIYMDSSQFFRDVKGGLIQLTLNQLNVIRHWGKEGGKILAVGDIVPLLFAWWSGTQYGFVGTAKSEYYLRDEQGILPRQSWLETWEGWSGSVYLPWERWLMNRPLCRAVFPRDTLTYETLKQFKIPAYDLGNPMMDDLEISENSWSNLPNIADKKDRNHSLIITLLPGSRIPEAYENWQLILEAVGGILAKFSENHLLFLAAIAPNLSLEPFTKILEKFGWNDDDLSMNSCLNFPQFNSSISLLPSPNNLGFKQNQNRLILTQNNFNQCLNLADLAMGMAGTATEQFVGLGKPVITITGRGPQFTPAFAEAQTRLLGLSVTLVKHPQEVPQVLEILLQDPQRLELIRSNGKRRMGKPGAAQRIAQCLMDRLSS